MLCLRRWPGLAASLATLVMAGHLCVLSCVHRITKNADRLLFMGACKDSRITSLRGHEICAVAPVVCAELHGPSSAGREQHSTVVNDQGP